MINFGSFFSTMITPWTLQAYGPSVAFGIPGILMFLATIIFWMGRNEYVHVPPTGPNPHGTGKVIFSGLKNLGKGKGFFGGAMLDHPENSVNDLRAAFNVGKIFVGVTIFWALFDQHGSSWVLQAKEMNLDVNLFGWQTTLLPSQIPALNPIMVMVLIPFFTFGVYPLCEKVFKTEMTPLKRMSGGMFVSAAAFGIVAILQMYLDGGDKISVLWQFFPFLIITMAEVMVSITGLQFAYTQAPRSMKSTIMSMWLLTVFFGNIVTAFFSYTAEALSLNGSLFFWFFTALMVVAGVLFVWMAKNYKMQDFMEK